MKADKTPTEWPTEDHIDRVGLNGERDYSEPFVTRFASAGAMAIITRTSPAELEDNKDD